MVKQRKPARNASQNDAGGEEKINNEHMQEVARENEFPGFETPLKEAEKEKEQLSQEEIEKLREKIEATDLDDSLKAQANSAAQNIKTLAQEEKIKKLLDIAAQKGIIYAVNVAKKTNDPYLLDMLHDRLAAGGYYEKFLK